MKVRCDCEDTMASYLSLSAQYLGYTSNLIVDLEILCSRLHFLIS